MDKIRYAVAGTGWRAMFYVRAAKKLPERFELTGVLCRTKEKAEAFEAEHGVRAFWSLEALLAEYGELGAYGVVSRKKSSGPSRSP